MGDPEEGRIDPAPRRTGPTWSLFLRSQAEAILACDFFTADPLDGTQAYVLAVIEHASRRVRILGVTLHPTGEWTTQQARNLIMDLGEHAHRVKFMIRDRGSNFTAAFDEALADAGIRTVLCNVQTPRMNATAERWTGGCHRELLAAGRLPSVQHLSAGYRPQAEARADTPAGREVSGCQSAATSFLTCYRGRRPRAEVRRVLARVT